jgi:hypothetical protein
MIERHDRAGRRASCGPRHCRRACRRGYRWGGAGARIGFAAAGSMSSGHGCAIRAATKSPGSGASGAMTSGRGHERHSSCMAGSDGRAAGGCVVTCRRLDRVHHRTGRQPRSMRLLTCALRCAASGCACARCGPADPPPDQAPPHGDRRSPCKAEHRSGGPDRDVLVGAARI